MPNVYDFFVGSAYADLHWFGSKQYGGRSRGIVTFEFLQPISISVAGKIVEYTKLVCYCSADATTQTVTLEMANDGNRLASESPLDDFERYLQYASLQMENVFAVNGAAIIDEQGKVTSLSLKLEPKKQSQCLISIERIIK